MKPDLVIFDCDGVLVDSEVLAARNLVAVLTDLGFVPDGDPIDYVESFRGCTLAHLMETVSTDWGRPLPDDFLERLRANDVALFEKELKAIPGIAGALDRLDAAGIPFCVGSNGEVEKIRHSLTLVGLISRFEGRIFSAQMVAQGKPAPDLFLLAAKTMKAPPERCLVVEDSSLGIQGAVAAGMRAIGFVGGGHNRPEFAGQLRQAGAETVLASLNELDQLFK